MLNLSTVVKNRIVFGSRLAGYIGVGAGVPITTFAIKFGLFTKSVEATDAMGNVIQQPRIALNGWGIICIIILGRYLTSILKEIAESNQGYSMTKQCYDGVLKTLPLIMCYGICFFLNGVLTQIMFCLAILIVCRLAATPLNPLPKWKFEKTGIADYSDMVTNLTKYIKKIAGKEGD